MWASLETWQLGDGEVRELAAGDISPHAGLRANCSRLAVVESFVAEGAALADDSAAGLPRYLVRGVCLDARPPPQTARLGFSTVSVLAEPADVRPASNARDFGALERYSANFHLMQVGEVVEAECWLEIVADYEWDAFDLPHARRDCRIASIKLVRHELVTADHHGQPFTTRGDVTHLDVQGQHSRAADMRMGNRYLVDMRPHYG